MPEQTRGEKFYEMSSPITVRTLGGRRSEGAKEAMESLFGNSTSASSSATTTTTSSKIVGISDNNNRINNERVAMSSVAAAAAAAQNVSLTDSKRRLVYFARRVERR